jgi:hypothetical protein
MHHARRPNRPVLSAPHVTPKRPKAPKGTQLVTFRGGDILPELQARVSKPGARAGTAAKRDLRLYYDLLADALRGITLTPDERRLLTDVDIGSHPDAHRVLWGTVERAMRDSPQLLKDHPLPDPAAFIARLRALSPVESRALIDALERFWIAYRAGHGPAETVLNDVGLNIRDEQDA